MKIWNYYVVDDRKIRDVYLKILSRKTGQKYYRVSHPTFSRELSNEIINDLMKYLSLNKEQATWLLNSHTSKKYHLKKALLELDHQQTNHQYGEFYDFIYRNKMKHRIGYYIFTILFLFGFIFLLFMVTKKIPQEGHIGNWIALFIMFLSLIGGLSIYLYYRHIYLLEKDLVALHQIPISGSIIKIRLRQHLEYSRHGLQSLTFYGLTLTILENQKKIKIFYPFKMDDLILFGPLGALSKRQKKIQNRLQQITVIKTTCFAHSRVISESILRFDKLVSAD